MPGSYRLNTLLFIVFIFMMPSTANARIIKLKYVSGERLAEMEYSKGKLNGSYKAWYINGSQATQGFFVKGRREGPWTEWFQNGQKAMERYFRDDRQDGYFNTWYPNGMTDIQGFYKSGVRDSLWKYFFANGNQRAIVVFKYAFMKNWILWDSSGKFIRTFFQWDASYDSNNPEFDLTKKVPYLRVLSSLTDPDKSRWVWKSNYNVDHCDESYYIANKRKTIRQVCQSYGIDPDFGDGFSYYWARIPYKNAKPNGRALYKISITNVREDSGIFATDTNYRIIDMKNGLLNGVKRQYSAYCKIGQPVVFLDTMNEKYIMGNARNLGAYMHIFFQSFKKSRSKHVSKSEDICQNENANWMQTKSVISDEPLPPGECKVVTNSTFIEDNYARIGVNSMRNPERYLDECQTFYNTGELYRVGGYVGRMPIGLWTIYYKNGQKIAEGHFCYCDPYSFSERDYSFSETGKEGLQDGLWYFYNQDGSLKCTYTYHKGWLLDIKKY